MVEIPSNNQSNHNPSRFKLGFQKTWQGFLLFLEVIGLSRGKGVDHTPQVARLKLNHAEFRKLLSANNSFLETMTDIEAEIPGTGFSGSDLPQAPGFKGYCRYPYHDRSHYGDFGRPIPGFAG